MNIYYGRNHRYRDDGVDRAVVIAENEICAEVLVSRESEPSDQWWQWEHIGTALENQDAQVILHEIWHS